MALTTNERLQEVFALALEQRSRGYADLVSNANAILTIMKSRNMFRTFSGPTIRESLLYNESGTYTRFSGYQLLNPAPAELINDAEYTPKQAAVSVVLSGEDIMKNSGRNQIRDIMKVHMMAAEQELTDRFTEDLHSDGQADGGLQVGGLQAAIPTDPTTGTYGGIDRATHAIWRTGSYDLSADDLGIGITSWAAADIKQILDNVMILHSRGKQGPDIIAMAKEPYIQYSKSGEEIQRITDERGVGGKGFLSLKYYGAGKSVDVLLEGGIGTAMPADTAYFLSGNTLSFRYHPDRNFQKFGGKQTPVNQDAVVQHIGFFGEFTLNNSLFNAKVKL